MVETAAELSSRLEVAVEPGMRGRLLDKGLARGLIWRDGNLPEGAPEFSESLSEDLLDYAHAVMTLALRLRAAGAPNPRVLERAFLVAGEAIEAAIHRGEDRHDRGFHRVTAAVAFHLGRYAARAFSMLPAGAEAQNLAPTEAALVELLRRRLDELHKAFSDWLLHPGNADEAVAARLEDDIDFDQTDAIHSILTNSFMRGLALFDHALTTGAPDVAEAARARLFATADAARDLNAVSHWWTATLAAHLVDELWGMSLHQQIPELPPDHEDHARWRDIRRGYIQRLRGGKRAAIELWPSQLAAAKRSLDLSDDLVVALPTSAGKTRIAELCILRTLASERRVVYVTPLRALSAQVERDLAESLHPLGFSVSSLYGSAGIESGDEETLREGRVVVSTPEKLDFALRNDPSIIDDVGLVVLDEGHMLGPNEREVRYEALVQRLVRRGDAAGRRIICLSALFPTPEEMSDLVAWLRADEPGDPIHSAWRPTRQRFGVLRWGSNAARLDVKVEEESPFIQRFIEQTKPPAGSRRRKSFPADKNELTLAAAWRFVEQQKDVLIYCPLRASVETLGRLVLKCIDHEVLSPFTKANQRAKDVMAVGAEWLGEDHPAVACLAHGVALHHGGLPRPFLNEVERLLRSGDCPVTIASPTLAQGLNLSASVLLIPSIWRSGRPIPAAEFANVAGRAGRAFVDVEGLVLHVVHEAEAWKARRALRNWVALLDAAKAPRVSSGILQLAALVFLRISAANGLPFDEVIDYVTGNAEGWIPPVGKAPSLDQLKEWVDVQPPKASAVASLFNDSFWQKRLGTDEEKKLRADEKDWDADVASLDAAILALLDVETSDEGVADALDEVLAGSLFSRQLGKQEAGVQELVRALVAARAQRIWLETVPTQRKGFHAAGIGLVAGKFIDTHLDELMQFLARAEASILLEDEEGVGQAVVAFADLVFQTAPFQAPKELPANWQAALLAWLAGKPSSEVLALCDGEGVDLIQEALAYRLPWAMEAVRVHALAVQHPDVDTLTGLAALAVEAGSSNTSVITLVRAGLSSREAAAAAVESTGASFADRDGMREWLDSELVQALSDDKEWPTARSRQAWIQFYEGKRKADGGKWKRETQRIRVKWSDSSPLHGTSVIVEPSVGTYGGVMTPDLQPLGLLQAEMRRPRRDLVSAQVGADGKTVEIEFFGPRGLR
ncbi:DEAD/DEAH box helicase [Sorangium sp. So ce281]|uniref:DEAD/DEAH box helicase n=1 Tax=unclassified Sorangium TaxID=2621164 RepID=UPI003F63E417